MKKILAILMFIAAQSLAQGNITLEVPPPTPQYEVAEFVVRIKNPGTMNPFTEVDIYGVFKTGDESIHVDGFADSPDGSVFRLRFSPEIAKAKYDYEITVKGKGIDSRFTGILASKEPLGKGPVVADPEFPKHFIYEGSKEPFFHVGYTAYNLVDISNDDALVDSTINYCKAHGFNKIRFLLAGYPRDYDNRTSDDVDHGVPEDPWKSLNYGAFPGRVNPLPAWEGKPHDYDFTRFNVAHWQRVDRAVRLMREKGIVATCIIMVEKQGLPKELGKLTEDEYRLYKYAVARLAAFDNVWWDLGNEHNEYRDKAWGDTMGDFVKEKDPYDRMASAHAYADFFYNDSPWADFIITQQYGDVDSVHNWVLRYSSVPKPYINEEYGYEGFNDKPIGHGMNSEWIRRCHWAIVMAGGYGTYGDWANGTSYFYMGFPGPGIAGPQMKFLSAFFEDLPFNEMLSSDDLTSRGYCLAKPGETYVIYLPEGGNAEIDLSNAKKNRMNAKWFEPATGKWTNGLKLRKGINAVNAPSNGDWALLIKSRK